MLPVGVGAAIVTRTPWPAIGGAVAFYALMLVSMIPSRAWLELDGTLAKLSWRAPLRVAKTAVGRWVLGGVDTPTGALLVLIGDDGTRVRVGGRDHDGVGYPRDARARSIDLAIDLDDFDSLAGLLGVTRARTGLEVELIASSQTARGIMRTMAPWILSLVTLCGLGAVLAMTSAGDRLASSPDGAIVLGSITGAIALLGLIATVARSLRVKRPSWIVRVSDAGLAIARGDDAREDARAAWAAVRAEPRRYLVRSRGGTTTLPALVLAIGARELVIGAYDSGQGWPDDTPRVRRAPPWLAGGAQWAGLIAVLRERGALRV